MRQACGVTLLLSGLAACFYAVTVLSARDYLGAMILGFMGTALLRAAVELLRPTLGG